MFLSEKELNISQPKGNESLLHYLANEVLSSCESDEIPIRFVITGSRENTHHCEIGVLREAKNLSTLESNSIFRFVPRKSENAEVFNCVLLIPTGIGAEIGGHAGDSTPVAKLLGSLCDKIILHPNVVNASDINEMPENSLYVEGSVICRLLMGTAGLQSVRNNKILVVLGDHAEKMYVKAAINSVNAARALCGIQCPRIVQLDSSTKMVADYSSSGRAAGQVLGLDSLFNLLDRYHSDYDAIAISSLIDIPIRHLIDYFRCKGEMINPWGGVEAMLTHAVSLAYNVPSAHSPMMESTEVANVDLGIVDPRMGAEAVSMTFLHCILKGLQRSPKIVIDPEAMSCHNTLTAADVSCLVIPDGCLGLPTLAALEQGIPVIAVRENRNNMQNDLTNLPWATDQFFLVDNYWEAAGVMTALREGIVPNAVRRPFPQTTIDFPLE